jgi:hypothetical protein
MKVIATCCMKADLYNVEFDDGIIIGIRYKDDSPGEYTGYMCSVGTDSYFMNKGFFPKGANLKKRVSIGTDIIKSRQPRYRRNPHNSENK